MASLPLTPDAAPLGAAPRHGENRRGGWGGHAMGHRSDASLFHNIAHRGASAHAPENSLEAFELAHRHRATDVEVDLHCTNDNQLVIRHDTTIHKTSPYISEMSYDEYRRLCARQNEPTVRLHEVFQVAADNNLGVYLDVKQLLPHAVATLLETIRHADYVHRTVVASFRTDIVKEVKQRSPQSFTSVLFHDPNMDLNSLVAGVDCDFLHPCFESFADPFEHFTRGWVDRATATGAGLIGWNVTTAEMADAVIAMGVLGACADDPRILADALTRRSPEAGASAVVS